MNGSGLPNRRSPLSLEEADFPKTRGNGNAPEVAVKIDQQTTNANTNSKPASGPFDTDERRLLKPVRPKALPAAGALVGSGIGSRNWPIG
jgi:hypothetical protein